MSSTIIEVILLLNKSEFVLYMVNQENWCDCKCLFRTQLMCSCIMGSNLAISSTSFRKLPFDGENIFLCPLSAKFLIVSDWMTAVRRLVLCIWVLFCMLVIWHHSWQSDNPLLPRPSPPCAASSRRTSQIQGTLTTRKMTIKNWKLIIAHAITGMKYYN